MAQANLKVDLLTQVKGYKVLGSPGKIYDIKGSFPKPDFTNWVHHKIAVFGLSCDSATDVWVQISGEETNKVLDLVAQLSSKGLTGPTLPLRIGSPVLAQWAEDKSWYRARITKINGPNYTVAFVDYGNEEVVSLDDLRDCPKELIDYVEGGTLCYLTGFTGLEVPDELHVLKAAIAEQDLIAEIDAVEYEIRGKTRVKLSIFDRAGRTLSDMVHEYVRQERLKKGLPVKPVVTSPPALQKLKKITNGVDAVDGTKQEASTLLKVPKVIKIGEAPKANIVISAPIPPVKTVNQLVLKPLATPQKSNSITKQDIGTSTSPSTTATTTTTTNHHQRETNQQQHNKEVETLRLRLKERDKAIADLTLTFTNLTTFYQKQIQDLEEELDETKKKFQN